MCVIIVRKCYMTKRKHKGFSFGIPMSWQEPNDHTSDCCFCLTNTKDIGKKKRQKISCPSIPSPVWPTLMSYRFQLMIVIKGKDWWGQSRNTFRIWWSFVWQPRVINLSAGGCPFKVLITLQNAESGIIQVLELLELVLLGAVLPIATPGSHKKHILPTTDPKVSPL